MSHSAQHQTATIYRFPLSSRMALSNSANSALAKLDAQCFHMRNQVDWRASYHREAIASDAQEE